jgi:hypothetical protein
VEQINPHSDQRIATYADDACIHCGGAYGDRGGLTRDHVPSKVLLHKPYPQQLPAVNACFKCNNRFSADEQYVDAFLASVLAGTTNPAEMPESSGKQILARKPLLRMAINRSQQPRGSSSSQNWAPEEDRFATVLTKNARGHLWFELHEIRLESPTVNFEALATLDRDQRRRFENASHDPLLPEVGTRQLDRIITQRDMLDEWVVVQQGIYRFAIDRLRGSAVRVRMVMSEYLAAELIW